MADQPSHPEQEQIERAQRLRKQIERLKEGLPKDDQGKEQSKSLNEQIEEREAEQRKSNDPD